MFKEKIFKFFKKADNDNTEKIDTSYTTDTDNIKDNIAYNTRFDTSVTSVLKKAGWYEGRKIDMSEQLKIFESLGIDVFDKAKEFIQEFDGLKIPATDFRFDENNKNHFHYFDVMHDIKGMYDILIEQKEDCEKILMRRNFCNERVLPVGGLHGWGLGLYITESGKLINDVRVYGNTIEEGVKNLVLHKSVGSIADLLPITPVKSTVENEKTDEKVVYLLKKSGWYEGRKTDISKLVEMLEEAGFEVFEKAREFMTEFDGLTIPRIYAKDYSNGTRATDFYHFDVQKVTAWIFKNCTPEERKKVAGTVGKHMCFRDKVFQIGELGQSDVPLYITRDGKIVSDRLLYGNTIEEGMQNLLSDKHLGLIPALPPEDPEKARLQQERFKDYNKHYLTNLSLDKENGIVSWLYESDTIKTERLKNCTWCNFYSKLFVMITTKENNTKKNTLYDAYANFVLAYNIEENKIFTSKTDFYIVDNLQFVAYNRHLNRLIVLTGDTSDNHCLYIYDLNGNITAQIQPPDGMVISSAKIDYIDYNILISCKAVADINTSDNAKESVYNIDYDNDTLVKNILFD